jgi:hypothetical protein
LWILFPAASWRWLATPSDKIPGIVLTVCNLIFQLDFDAAFMKQQQQQADYMKRRRRTGF